jgi:hypothetical protein
MEQLQTVAAGTAAGLDYRRQPKAHRKLLASLEGSARRHRYSRRSQLPAGCVLVGSGHHEALWSADDPVADTSCVQQGEAALKHAGCLWRDKDYRVGISGGVQKSGQFLSACHLAATDADRQAELGRCRQQAVGEESHLAFSQLKRIVG